MLNHILDTGMTERISKLLKKEKKPNHNSGNCNRLIHFTELFGLDHNAPKYFNWINYSTNTIIKIIFINI